MKRLLLVLIVLFSLGTAANAAPITFTAVLNALNESPTNSSPGTGFANVTIDSVLHTMRVQVTFSGLTTPNTAAHIHVINGPGDANTADTLGPVATTTPTFTGFPGGTTAGSFDATFDMTLASSYRAGFITDAGGSTALAEAALFSGITDGRAYLNIHTTQNGGGEIRGFLVTAPEPATLMTLGLALTAIAIVPVVRRRRQK